ncbi:Dimodular nonribosomal peptide synthase [Mycobacterium marinum]|nr:condensation domain-containing protein [Mycobacterium marinum]RFZ25072.1 Dimodular nonribosomal peptide synthase [Mycobacterium marinum]
MWFLHKYEGPSATYNIPLAVRLTGEIDAVALCAAIVDVVARHESLRTLFTESDGIPCQQVLAVEDVDVPVVVTEVAAQGLAAAAIDAVGYRLDLATEIPIRAELLRVSPTEHVLVVMIHHIAADGASLVPLARDVATAYTARLVGRAPDWAPLAVQYADYTLCGNKRSWAARTIPTASCPTNSLIGAPNWLMHPNTLRCPPIDPAPHNNHSAATRSR